MDVATLQRAIGEAGEFLRLACKVSIENITPKKGQPYLRVADNNKNTAACKRASMNLTRTLADLRQGR